MAKYSNPFQQLIKDNNDSMWEADSQGEAASVNNLLDESGNLDDIDENIQKSVIYNQNKVNTQFFSLQM